MRGGVCMYSRGNIGVRRNRDYVEGWGVWGVWGEVVGRMERIMGVSKVNQ